MSNVAVVFWSGTGNTEAMANAVAEGINEKGAESALIAAAEFSADMMDQYDAIAFGCPAMGGEELEPDEFEPMWEGVQSNLNNRKIALFGSYGWGDGEWMRTWEESCRDAGAILAHESVICQETPDDEAVDNCKALGAALA